MGKTKRAKAAMYKKGLMLRQRPEKEYAEKLAAIIKDVWGQEMREMLLGDSASTWILCGKDDDEIPHT